MARRRYLYIAAGNGHTRDTLGVEGGGEDALKILQVLSLRSFSLLVSTHSGLGRYNKLLHKLSETCISFDSNPTIPRLQHASTCASLHVPHNAQVSQVI